MTITEQALAPAAGETITAQLANRGYELNPRSGMISLDLPPGTVTPVPGGVSDHHITVAYLGPDVDDEAFTQACSRAKDAAAAMPGSAAGNGRRHWRVPAVKGQRRQGARMGRGRAARCGAAP